MWQFIKYILATILGLAIFFFLGFFLLVGFVSALGSSSQPTVSLEANSILKLNLGRAIAERGIDNPLEDLPLPGASDSKVLGLIELRQAIAKAKTDEKISGIYLSSGSVGAPGFASLQEIREMLVDFKKSGKFIYAFAEGYSEGGYFVNSVADRIFLHPAGALEMNGLNIEVMFFKRGLDKLGVKPEIFRVGDFKSAVEPFFLEKMSEENRLQYTSFLNSIYDHYLKTVADARKIPLADLRAVADQMKVQTPADALKLKLVTDTAYYDQVEAALQKAAKHENAEKPRFVALDDYLKNVDAEEESPAGKDRVAVVVAQGDIVDGKGGQDMIGGDAIAAELRKIRRDDKVKAVVLRINSPGGSALASDIMWREVELLKKAGKPVIASMGDYAASGGYYMAMPCHTIVAQPNTITGSIGVFGVFFTAQELLNDKLGITTDNVKTSQFADLGDPDRPMNDAERQIIQNGINRIYADFTGKVAAGRKMALDSVRRLAGGRVWTGEQAKANGLVDVLGSYDDAVKLAAKTAKLNEYAIKYYPKKSSIFDAFTETEGLLRTHMLKQELGEAYPIYQQYQKLRQVRGAQARLPFGVVGW
jgi:protease IV